MQESDYIRHFLLVSYRNERFSLLLFSGVALIVVKSERKAVSIFLKEKVIW